jgi:hypothetical protein
MRDGDQGLAITVGLLLVVGGVLIGVGLVGVWRTFTVAVVLIVGGYLSPAVARWVTVRRFARSLRRL